MSGTLQDELCRCGKVVREYQKIESKQIVTSMNMVMDPKHG